MNNSRNVIDLPDNKQCIHCYALVSSLSPLSWNFSFRRNLNELKSGDMVALLAVLEGVTCCQSCARWNWGPHESFILIRTFGKLRYLWKVHIFVWLVSLRWVNTCGTVQRRRPQVCLSPQWCVMCKASSDCQSFVSSLSCDLKFVVQIVEGAGGTRQKVLSGVVQLCFGCYGRKKKTDLWVFMRRFFGLRSGFGHFFGLHFCRNSEIFLLSTILLYWRAAIS